MKEKPQKNTAPHAPQSPPTLEQTSLVGTPPEKPKSKRGGYFGGVKPKKPTKQMRIEAVLYSKLEKAGFNPRAWIEQKIRQDTTLEKPNSTVSNVSDS